ncbi:hypothetical protein OSTOST_01709, partial [Ostertagia ostertagi]
AARAGIEHLFIPDENVIEKAQSARGGDRTCYSSAKEQAENATKVEELEWEAWMRVLDCAGFRTGHVYRKPSLLSKSVTTHSSVNASEVAVPPTSSATGMIDGDDSEAVAAHKLALLRKEQQETQWLNSPNVYQKVEILETGTDNPKVITKWIRDAISPSSSGMPVKISMPQQFSPVSSNQKEFKDKQRAIRVTLVISTTSWDL